MMKKIVFLIAFGGSVLLSGNTVSAGNFRAGNDNCIVTTDLVIKEGSIGYERLSGSLRGRITNFSRDYTYGKIQLKVKFLDKNGNELGTETTVISRNIKGGESDLFLEHLKSPKYTDHVQCEIVCAEITP